MKQFIKEFFNRLFRVKINLHVNSEQSAEDILTIMNSVDYNLEGKTLVIIFQTGTYHQISIPAFKGHVILKGEK